MKSFLLVMIAFTLALSLLPSCQPAMSKDVKPKFAVSTQFDGQWHGKRIITTPDLRCQPTEISGSVTQGFIDFTLHYNNTRLTGWMAENGKFELQDDSPRWDYYFSGQAQDREIKGTWSVGNAPCAGTWSVTRQ